MIRLGSRKGRGFCIMEMGPMVVTDIGTSKVGRVYRKHMEATKISIFEA